MLIKQVSIFVENKPGKISDVIDLLGTNNIDIIALSIADTTDYGILRLIVDKPSLCQQIVKKENFIVKITDVIAIKIDNKPGSLMNALHVLKNEDIQIDYMYAFVGTKGDNARVMLKVSDPFKALDILNKNNIDSVDGLEIQSE